jgi:hypothetical protein
MADLIRFSDSADDWAILFTPNDPADEVGIHAVVCRFTRGPCDCLNCTLTEPCAYRIETEVHP